MLLNPRPALHFLRRAPLGRGLAGRPAAFEILDKPRFLYVVLDDGPARPPVGLNGTRRPRGPHKWKAAVTFLAKQGDNGIVWNILSYWRATH